MTADLITKNSGTKDEAQDIFQDALVVLFEKAQDPSFQLSSTVKTYIYAVCRNKWLMTLRSRKSRKTHLSDTEALDFVAEESVQADIEQQERNDLMRKYFEKLGTDCQKVLNMFFKGTSMRNIAEAMGFTEGYAKKRKFTCQKQLITMVTADNRYQELTTL